MNKPHTHLDHAHKSIVFRKAPVSSEVYAFWTICASTAHHTEKRAPPNACRSWHKQSTPDTSHASQRDRHPPMQAASCPPTSTHSSVLLVVVHSEGVDHFLLIKAHLHERNDSLHENHNWSTPQHWIQRQQHGEQPPCTAQPGFRTSISAAVLPYHHKIFYLKSFHYSFTETHLCCQHLKPSWHRMWGSEQGQGTLSESPVRVGGAPSHHITLKGTRGKQFNLGCTVCPNEHMAQTILSNQIQTHLRDLATQ
jgi:hypothetical protein